MRGKIAKRLNKVARALGRSGRELKALWKATPRNQKGDLQTMVSKVLETPQTVKDEYHDAEFQSHMDDLQLNMQEEDTCSCEHEHEEKKPE